jgi:undecaprenyl-diphosphatase
MLAWLETIDHGLFFLINGKMGADWLDPVFLGLSSLGEWTIVVVAGAFLAESGRRVLMRHLLVVLVALAVLGPIHYGLKALVGRDRPKEAFKEQVESGTVTMRAVEKGTPKHNGFPSGHSALAFFLMTYVALQRRACRWPALVLAGLVAFSRVYVGAHFPSDCLVGSLIGAGGGWAAWFVFKRFEPRSERTS